MKTGGARVIRVSSPFSFDGGARFQLCNSHPVPPFMRAPVHHRVCAFQESLAGIALDWTCAADGDGHRKLFSLSFDPGIADDLAKLFSDREHIRIGVREKTGELLAPQCSTPS